MGAARKAVAALRREEGGLTLIELLVATGIGLVVVAGAMSVFLSGVRSQPRVSSKVASIQQGRFTIDRIVRELRQGLEVSDTPAHSQTQLGIVTYVKATSCGGAAASTAIPCKVTYSCSGDSCTRQVAQPDGGAPGPAVQVVTGLTSPGIFTYTPPSGEPSFIGVTLSLETESEPVTLGDGAALRNPSEES
jgi:type II secretory pathway pseudopilin PulG